MALKQKAKKLKTQQNSHKISTLSDKFADL